MAATIELAKNVDWGNVKYPVYVQQKFDGVPLKFTGTECITRQGETVTGLPVSFINKVNDELLRVAALEEQSAPFLVAEACFGDQPFKVTSGIIRRKEPCSEADFKRFTFHVFDCRVSNDIRWLDRYTFGVRNLFDVLPEGMRFIRTHKCCTKRDVEAAYDKYVLKDGAEGIMLHDGARVWSPGKRCWGLQRWKQHDTLDLPVVDFVEAISQEGYPLGQVGRINVQYSDSVIGVGPGRLTLTERARLWKDRANSSRYIVEVKYKPDESYRALREASVVSIRFDKMGA